ncbi:MAG: hypothetical protein EOO49_13565 [Flavobacterium sp.]|nr:MAG: hypothetical protein EOO49_13565 [Flavobacterium sp.]
MTLQDFLASSDKNNVAVAALARVPLASKTAKAASMDCDSILIKLQIKKEILEVEQNYLIAKLKPVLV